MLVEGPVQRQGPRLAHAADVGQGLLHNDRVLFFFVLFWGWGVGGWTTGQALMMWGGGSVDDACGSLAHLGPLDDEDEVEVAVAHLVWFNFGLGWIGDRRVAYYTFGWASIYVYIYLFIRSFVPPTHTILFVEKIHVPR